MKRIENKTYLAYYPTSPLGENSITQMLELMSFIGLPHKNAMVILFAGMYGFFEVPFPEMPTSGDLKSGDTISCAYSGQIRFPYHSGGVLQGFLGGDVLLGPWNPQSISELVQLNFATLHYPKFPKFPPILEQLFSRNY